MGEHLTGLRSFVTMIAGSLLQYPDEIVVSVTYKDARAILNERDALQARVTALEGALLRRALFCAHETQRIAQ